MTTLSSIEKFFAQKKLALIGISRSGKKFGNTIIKELKLKGYTLFPIHPNASTIQGERCYPTLKDLPEKVGGVILVIPPTETEIIVPEIANAGIKNIWMQQGSESENAIQFCRDHGINVIHGECILMFAEPLVFFHKLHRWVWKLVGKYPK